MLTPKSRTFSLSILDILFPILLFKSDYSSLLYNIFSSMSSNGRLKRSQLSLQIMLLIETSMIKQSTLSIRELPKIRIRYKLGALPRNAEELMVQRSSNMIITSEIK